MHRQNDARVTICSVQEQETSVNGPSIQDSQFQVFGSGDHQVSCTVSPTTGRRMKPTFARLFFRPVVNGREEFQPFRFSLKPYDF